MPTYHAVEQIVIQKVRRTTFLDIIEYVTSSEPLLWGTEQPPHFYRQTTTLILYHDLMALGWHQVVKVTNICFPLSHNSLWHNAKVIRKLLNEWAFQYIPIGTPQDWTNSARHAKFMVAVKDATLAIDSFDLAIQRKGKLRGRKSHYWSAKLNRPGWRFMVITDASRRIRLISSGYSPKIYDGHWLQARRDDIEWFFKHGVFVADNHFEAGKDFDDVKFYVTTRTSRKKEDDEDDSDMVRLIKWEEDRNKAIRNARSRIELTIHSLKAPWKALSQPWAEELNQLSYLVHIATAVHNLSL